MGKLLNKFEWTEKQVRALEYMGFKNKFYDPDIAARILYLYGGAGSAKTFVNLSGIVKRAIIAPKSQHGIFRADATVCFASIYGQGLPEVMQKVYPSLEKVATLGKPKTARWYTTNEQRHEYRFYNGSMIKCLGLYDNIVSKADSLLGFSFNTIFINEASNVSYDSYIYLLSRLRGSEEHIKQLFLMDCNPPSVRHWLYKMFEQGINPETDKPLKSMQGMKKIKMNPVDNPYLSDEYVESLGGDDVSESRKHRLYYGNYTAVNDNALFALEAERAYQEGRITDLDVNTSNDVHLILDVGGTTAYWILRVNQADRRIEMLDYNEIKRRSLDSIVEALILPFERGGQGWNIKTIAMGHDCLHPEGGSGMSHYERLENLKDTEGYIYELVPLKKPKTKQENVDALRWWFKYFWFDKTRTAKGMACVDNCEAIDKHDDFLHGVDALMYAAVWCGYARHAETACVLPENKNKINYVKEYKGMTGRDLMRVNDNYAIYNDEDWYSGY